jgi:two-component system, NarL family, invasion response regulator UvrY
MKNKAINQQSSGQQPNAQQISIMLADDHAVVRAGVRRLLEQDARFIVIAEVESGENAYHQYGGYCPDILIIDLSMPGMGGMEAISRILMRYPAAKILVLSMHENAAFASQAIKAGARGYLTKNGLADELINAIVHIANGQTYLNASMSQKITQQFLNTDTNHLQQLSAREFEIFRLLAEGVDSTEIGKILNISGKTVANYQTTIKQKLGIHNSVELVRLAIRNGLIDSA